MVSPKVLLYLIGLLCVSEVSAGLTIVKRAPEVSRHAIVTGETLLIFSRRTSYQVPYKQLGMALDFPASMLPVVFPSR
jgi:hypothetical protein